MKRELTETQRCLLLNALHCYALGCAADATAGLLVAEATRAVNDALELAELIENADVIEVTP